MNNPDKNYNEKLDSEKESNSKVTPKKTIWQTEVGIPVRIATSLIVGMILGGIGYSFGMKIWIGFSFVLGLTGFFMGLFIGFFLLEIILITKLICHIIISSIFDHD